MRQVREIKKKLGAAAPDTIAKLRSGAKTIKQVKRDLRVAERTERVEQAQQIAATPDPDRCRLLHCDLADAALDSESVDAIITDPPYPKEFLSVYGSLAKLAGRCLRPGGVLFGDGRSILSARGVRDALRSDDLTYHWALAYLTPGGQSPQIWPRKVNTFWKPVLWFVKGITLATGRRCHQDAAQRQRQALP